MKRMFASATLKLTAWYLIILVAISLVFSIIIFEISTNEVRQRLERLQIRLEGSGQTLVIPGPVTLSDLRANQAAQARTNIFFGLLYMNIAVIGLGGVGSYLLAKRTLRPIEAAHESQSRFTSDASHELRTPLAVMKSEIQVALRDTSITKKELQELLRSNLEEVDKLTTLSQSLLQLSRLDYDQLSLAEKIDIGAVIRDSAAGFQQLSDRFDLTIPKRRIIIDGNHAMIADLMRILLDNSLKYSPADSTIQVNVRKDGRNCSISVVNDGDGIKPDDLPHIFDRFYRGDKSRSSQGEHGYGLGLALAKQIVDMHDGTLSAASTPGKTTTFLVVLPEVQKNR